MQEPWFRKQTWSWYVEDAAGKQHSLGKHPSETAPRKGKKGWTPPPEIERAWLRLMRDSGQVAPPRDLPLGELFQEFLDAGKGSVKEDTRAWYRVFLEDFLGHFPNLLASQVTEAVVHRWLKAEHKRPWGKSTHRSAITILKAAFNWAVKNGLIDGNPIRYMAKPPAQRREKVVTAEERADITDLYPEGDPFRDFLMALNESGARPGEIMRLTAADVDLWEGVATLSEHKTRGKTGRSRTIYLTPRLAELLARLMEQHPSGPLFLNADGNPWNRQAINCRFRRKRNRKTDSIQKGIVAYSWRHGYVTDALEKGVPPATVAELVGHSDLQTVARHYAHIAEKKKHLKEAARKATE